jgi:hypothetical protein
MTPLRIAGAALLLVGLLIVGLGGLSYTRERQTVEIGNLELSAERKGVVPPAVGVVAMLIGAGLLVFPRKRS